MSARSPLLEHLQSGAVRGRAAHPREPVLIVASTGWRKTRALTHRKTCLIREHGVNPYSVLAITFTNKAAREMAQRVEELLGERIAKGTWILTFHSACVRILRREHKRTSVCPAASRSTTKGTPSGSSRTSFET